MFMTLSGTLLLSGRFDLESMHVESIWLHVRTGRGPLVFVAFVYRKPSSSFVWFDEFVTMMDRVQAHKHTNDTLPPGDFNIDVFKSNPAWIPTLSLFILHQCVESATRVALTTSTLIDVCTKNQHK